MYLLVNHAPAGIAQIVLRAGVFCFAVAEPRLAVLLQLLASLAVVPSPFRFVQPMGLAQLLRLQNVVLVRVERAVVIQGIGNRRQIAVYGIPLLLTELAIVGVNFGYAQEILPKLAVVETTVMQSIADHSTLIPIKSDAEGNIYVRFYQPDVGKAPLVKVKRDSSEMVTSALPPRSGLGVPN